MPIIDENVSENQKSESLFFVNVEAKMSFNSGMTSLLSNNW